MTQKKTILCVDDDQSLSIHRLMLETRGYRVLTANNEGVAIEVLRAGGVDLVLSSVELPDAPGSKLAHAAKAIAPELPVILLSTNLRAFQTDAPVDLFLRKGSYLPAELLERIRLLLIKRRGPRRAVISPDRRIAAC
jgi:DNA-binding response OmpR family regulator